jgi:hypothetical protein
MILKEMLNQVLSQSAFIKKSAFVTSNDVDDQQMVAIANKAQLEIIDMYDWPQLLRSGEIKMIGSTRRYQMPSDYRSLVPDSMFKENSNERVEIQTPERRMYEYKFSATSPGPGIHARFIGNDIEFYGVNADDIVRFEYVSKWGVQDDTGSVKHLFNSDTDAWLLEDNLLILGIQAHWADTKMLPQTQLWRGNYMSKLNEAIGRNTGGRTIGGVRTRGRNRSPYTPLYR